MEVLFDKLVKRFRPLLPMGKNSYKNFLTNDTLFGATTNKKMALPVKCEYYAEASSCSFKVSNHD